MTVTILLQADPALLTCLNTLATAIAGSPCVDKIRSIRVRPDEGSPDLNTPVPVPDQSDILPRKRKAKTPAAAAALDGQAETASMYDSAEAEAPAQTPEPATSAARVVERPADGVVTVETLRALAVQKRDEGKREGLKALIVSFGTNSITEMDAEHYESFYQKLLAL